MSKVEAVTTLDKFLETVGETGRRRSVHDVVVEDQRETQHLARLDLILHGRLPTRKPGLARNAAHDYAQSMPG